MNLGSFATVPIVYQNQPRHREAVMSPSATSASRCLSVLGSDSSLPAQREGWLCRSMRGVANSGDFIASLDVFGVFLKPQLPQARAHLGPAAVTCVKKARPQPLWLQRED